jgi:hypothetical protein
MTTIKAKRKRSSFACQIFRDAVIYIRYSDASPDTVEIVKDELHIRENPSSSRTLFICVAADVIEQVISCVITARTDVKGKEKLGTR